MRIGGLSEQQLMKDRRAGQPEVVAAHPSIHRPDQLRMGSHHGAHRAGGQRIDRVPPRPGGEKRPNRIEVSGFQPRRLHPQHYAEPATSPGTTAERAPVATKDGIDYTVVQAFADKHGVSYNAACAMVRAACAGVQPSTGAGVGLHPDTMLLNWLEQHGTGNFDFETAQVRFPIPESFRAADSLREIFDAARAHQEHADQLEGAA